MFGVLLEAVGLENASQVVGHGAVLLVRELFQLVVLLHLLDESLEQLGVLLGEVRLFLSSLLLLHGDSAHGELGEQGHSWLNDHE